MASATSNVAMNKTDALRVLKIDLVINVPGGTTSTVEGTAPAGDATVQIAVGNGTNSGDRVFAAAKTTGAPADHDRPVVATRPTLAVTEIGPETDRAVNARRNRPRGG